MTLAVWALAVGILGQVAPVPIRVLSLREAEQKAIANQPQISQAKAQTLVARAQADEQRAPLLPQVNGIASYGRATSNFVLTPGTLPSSVKTTTSKADFDTIASYRVGVTANQLVYDFGETYGNWRAAQMSADAVAENEETVRQAVVLSVRSAYLAAWAQQQLVDVWKENLANQDRHLQQTEGQVKAGSRPEIDLAQVRADRSSAELTVINTENAYEIAKAQLNQAMGVDQSTDYIVADDRMPDVEGEDLSDDRLTAAAVAARPEIRNLSKQLDAAHRQISSDRGGYGPNLNVTAGVNEAGNELSTLIWNVNAGVSLTWPLFQGGLTNARVRQDEASLVVTRSQAALERQQIRFDVTQARLAVRAGKAALITAKEVERNAKEQLRLAEARYQAGAGSIIEQQDAQVAATTASGQVIQADYSLSLARAQLIKALGRPWKSTDP